MLIPWLTSPVFAGGGITHTDTWDQQKVTFGDLDGDGATDFVYGDRNAGGTATCPSGYGSIVVRYGSDLTLEEVMDRSSGLTGARRCGDLLGASVAIGDVDGDGYDDLAVGAPGATQVLLIHGSSAGLVLARQSLFSSSAGPTSAYGVALAAGDLDCDGYDDLAIGLPGIGAVGLLGGSGTGLVDRGVQIVQSSLLGDIPETGDAFGTSLAAGDPDQDRCDDLAISAPGEDVDGVSDAGVVHLLYGDPRGVGATDRERIQQTGALGSPTREQWLGAHLAMGDATGDGRDDLILQLAADRTVAVLPGGATHLGPAVVWEGVVDVIPSSFAADTTVHVSADLAVGRCTEDHRWCQVDYAIEPAQQESCCGGGDCCISGSCEGLR